MTTQLSYNDFNFIIFYLFADYICDTSEQKETDKLQAIAVSEASVQNLHRVHTIEDLTLNKRLVTFQANSPFCQYILNKSEKHGMKVVTCINVKMSHTQNLAVTQLSPQ